MLVRITNACNEMCLHCCVAATPDGAHMNDDVFKRTCDFLQHAEVRMVAISGGEPTLHPKFEDVMLDLLRLHSQRAQFGKKFHIALLSNGTWVTDSGKILFIKELISKGVSVQVSTQQEFYKSYQLIRDHAEYFSYIGCELFDGPVKQLVRIGRCGLRDFPDFPVTPNPCANTILMARQVTMNRWLSTMESQGQFCKPSINIDGTIVVGESPQCAVIGTVDDTVGRVYTNVKNKSPRVCNKCHGWHALVNRHKAASEYFTGKKFPQEA